MKLNIAKAITLRSVLSQNHSDIALIVGNGINRYRSAHKSNSWDELLRRLAIKYHLSKSENIPKGIALTEFYDLLDLKITTSVTRESLQKVFCDLMENWEPHAHHKRIVVWAKKFECPVLTTNFDNVFSKAGGFDLHHVPRRGFSDFYPWDTYYGSEQLSDPCRGVGIWHINGMIHYHRRIRLGLSHYMGSVQRARSWMIAHKHGLLSNNDVADWRGANTWLHVLFHKPLLIFGLGLEENEVFLRWLLIERARYFRRFPDRKKAAWYAHTDHSVGSGKLFFLEGVGVRPVRVESYDELYGKATWESGW